MGVSSHKVVAALRDALSNTCEMESLRASQVNAVPSRSDGATVPGNGAGQQRLVLVGAKRSLRKGKRIANPGRQFVKQTFLVQTKIRDALRNRHFDFQCIG